MQEINFVAGRALVRDDGKRRDDIVLEKMVFALFLQLTR